MSHFISSCCVIACALYLDTLQGTASAFFVEWTIKSWTSKAFFFFLQIFEPSIRQYLKTHSRTMFFRTEHLTFVRCPFAWHVEQEATRRWTERWRSVGPCNLRVYVASFLRPPCPKSWWCHRMIFDSNSWSMIVIHLKFDATRLLLKTWCLFVPIIYAYRINLLIKFFLQPAIIGS